MKSNTKGEIRSLCFMLVLLIIIAFATIPASASASTTSEEDSNTAVSSVSTAAPEYMGHLFLTLTGKTGNTWQVRVYGQNPKAGYNITFEYSSYMAFSNDAKSWNNINSSHIKTVTSGIPAFSGVDIEITENWFADAIAVSYVCDDGYRYITYANYINKSTWTMSQYYTQVVA